MFMHWLAPRHNREEGGGGGGVCSLVFGRIYVFVLLL